MVGTGYPCRDFHKITHDATMFWGDWDPAELNEMKCSSVCFSAFWPRSRFAFQLVFISISGKKDMNLFSSA